MDDRDLKISSSIDRLARELPQEIQPSTDLWPAIEARLDTSEMADADAAHIRWPQAAGLAVVLIMASSLATTILLRGDDPVTSVTTESVGMPIATDLGLRAPELLAVSGLSDDDRDTVMTSLDILRAARAGIERALRNDPNNTGLHISWLRVYEQELDLLNDAAWTTNGLAERVKT